MTRTRRYPVKEIFGPTIQGEGAHSGRACVFLRFAICNLACTWCDTDFRPEGASKLTADEIATRLLDQDVTETRLVIVTGGEPTLHWDQAIADALAAAGFRVHMESNGTRPLAAEVDWLTVSPKPRFHGPNDRLLPEAEVPASECKVVVDETIDEATLARYERYYQCSSWFLQPCMDDRYDEHLFRTLALIGKRPKWRLSLQLHKIVGLP